MAVIRGFEQFELYIYDKPIKLLTDHQAIEPLIKRNRSNKTNSTRLTRWMDRLAHFTIIANHIAGKHLALTDYLSVTQKPSVPLHTDDAYDNENVINKTLRHYNSSPNTVALATTSTNQKAKQTKTNTK